MTAISDKKNGYSLSRQWWDFTADTSEKISTIHTALYFFIVDLNNRLNWCDAVELPTDMTMKSIKIKSYRAYKRTFDDLVRWGFLNVVNKSRNQHHCTEVALVLKAKANESALASKSEAKSKATDFTPIIYKNKPINKGGEQIAPPEKDFINTIIQTYSEVFTDTVNAYSGKNRNAVGRLLRTWKGTHPEQTTEETLTSLKEYFTRCKNISDAWYAANMSLSLIDSKFTEIGRILNNPKRKHLERPQVLDSDNLMDMRR
jgi:hypothetical protein